MNTRHGKFRNRQNQAIANTAGHTSGGGANKTLFEDNRPQAVQLSKLQDIADNRSRQDRRLQKMQLRFPGRTANADVVQADVGFEFQTFQSKSGFYRQTEMKDNDGNSYDYFVKHTGHGTYAKVSNSDWRIENDGGDIEVVIERVDETKSGREALSATLGRIEAFFTKLGALKGVAQDTGKRGKITSNEQMIKASRIHRSKPATAAGLEPGVNWKPELEDCKLLVTDELKAHPQVTSGFRLEKLYEAFELLGQADFKKAQKVSPDDQLSIKKRKLADQLGFFKPESSTYRKHRETIRESVKQFGGFETLGGGNLDGYPALKGFLTIVSSYIIGWQKNRLRFRKIKTKDGKTKNKRIRTQYAKNYIPIMSRTDLSLVFESLPGKDQAVYKALVTSKGGPEKMMSQFGLDKKVLDRPLFGEGGNMGAYLKDRKLGKITALDKNREQISVKEFLQALASTHPRLINKPTDLSSQQFGPQAMGIQNKPKDVDIGLSQKDQIAGKGKGRSGIAVELRRLRENVPLNEWAQFALAAFDLTVMINEDQDPRDWK